MAWTDTKDSNSLVASADWNDMADQIIQTSGAYWNHSSQSNIHFPSSELDGQYAPSGVGTTAWSSAQDYWNHSSQTTLHWPSTQLRTWMDGTYAPTGGISAGSGQLTLTSGLSADTSVFHVGAASQMYLDAHQTFTSVSSSTVSSATITADSIIINANTISGLSTPLYPSSAANKDYVDNISSSIVTWAEGSFAPTGIATTSWSSAVAYWNHSSQSTIHFTKESLDDDYAPSGLNVTSWSANQAFWNHSSQTDIHETSGNLANWFDGKYAPTGVASTSWSSATAFWNHSSQTSLHWPSTQLRGWMDGTYAPTGAGGLSQDTADGLYHPSGYGTFGYISSSIISGTQISTQSIYLQQSTGFYRGRIRVSSTSVVFEDGQNNAGIELSNGLPGEPIYINPHRNYMHFIVRTQGLDNVINVAGDTGYMGIYRTAPAAVEGGYARLVISSNTRNVGLFSSNVIYTGELNAKSIIDYLPSSDSKNWFDGLYAPTGLSTTSWSSATAYWNHSSQTTLHFTKESLDDDYAPSGLNVTAWSSATSYWNHSSQTSLHWPSTNLRLWMDGTYAPTGSATAGSGQVTLTSGLSSDDSIFHVGTATDMYLDEHQSFTSVSSSTISSATVTTSDLTLNANTISGLTLPTYPSAAANKNYVDNISSSIITYADGAYSPTGAISQDTADGLYHPSGFGEFNYLKTNLYSGGSINFYSDYLNLLWDKAGGAAYNAMSLTYPIGGSGPLAGGRQVLVKGDATDWTTFMVGHSTDRAVLVAYTKSSQVCINDDQQGEMIKNHNRQEALIVSGSIWAATYISAQSISANVVTADTVTNYLPSSDTKNWFDGLYAPTGSAGTAWSSATAFWNHSSQSSIHWPSTQLRAWMDGTYAPTGAGGLSQDTADGLYYPSSLGLQISGAFWNHSSNTDIHWPSTNLRLWTDGTYAPSGIETTSWSSAVAYWNHSSQTSLHWPSTSIRAWSDGLYAPTGIATTSWSSAQDYRNHSSQTSLHWPSTNLRLWTDGTYAPTGALTQSTADGLYAPTGTLSADAISWVNVTDGDGITNMAFVASGAEDLTISFDTTWGDARYYTQDAADGNFYPSTQGVSHSYLSGLQDVTISAPYEGAALTYSGTKWTAVSSMKTALYDSKPTASDYKGQIIRTSGNANGTWVWISCFNGTGWEWVQLGY